MAMNPMQLMKLKERFEIFQRQHPKVLPFFKSLSGHVEVGSVIELKVTTPDGTEKVSNIKVTEDDIKTIAIISGRE